MDAILRAGALSLRLRPEWGGRVMSFSHDSGGDALLPITDRSFDPEAWPRAGAYPLAPFHNRIEGARFSFGGRKARLPPHPDTAPHALHGMASRLPWVLRGVDGRRAELSLRRAADEIWPWSFEARQIFDLDTEGLTVTVLLRNVDDAPMPGGVGWHPYLPRPKRIADDARTGWPVRPDYLPGPGPSPRGALSGDTLYLAQWGEVSVDLPGGLGLLFQKPVGLPHLVIHQPPGPFACVEPVSHLANALTQPGAPDMGPIDPGDEMTGRFRLAVRY